MTSFPTVLVFTCAEYGQANVHLATSYELALAGVNVCVSSFASLEARVSSLRELVALHALHSGGKPPGSILFHQLKDVTEYWNAIRKRGLNDADLPHPCGFSAALKCYLALTDIAMFPWDPEEHLAAIETVKRIIATIDPNVVVIDPLFLPAIDACQLVGQKFIILMPNSLKDIAANVQPRLAVLWKYPALSSGFPFPLKWWHIPLNIYLFIRLIIHVATSANIRHIQSVRRSLGITSFFGYEICRGVTYLCPALPEIDYPLTVVPDEVIPCGPIIMPFDPLEKSDPALMKWLGNGPTVVVNLGSHSVSDEKFAREMASALHLLLGCHDQRNAGRMQVLWKTKASEDMQKAINEVIGKEINEGRIKVVSWLEVEPPSILQHPNVVCTVHHGGASSYFEGVWSGVPHIVLPVWADTYDYANRVELLNIGLFGSKSCAPRVRADEFGQALVRVTGDTREASMIRSTAKRLRELCRAKGNGRKLSCMAILKEVGIKEENAVNVHRSP